MKYVLALALAAVFGFSANAQEANLARPNLVLKQIVGHAEG
jgi:hypothetical protein